MFGDSISTSLFFPETIPTMMKYLEIDCVRKDPEEYLFIYSRVHAK